MKRFIKLIRALFATGCTRDCNQGRDCPLRKAEPCPECGGDGEVMTAKLYPSGHSEVWEDCPICEGTGETS